MSKLWKKDIIIPEWVSVSLEDRKVIVTGPKGLLSYLLPVWVIVSINGSNISFSIIDDSYKSLWGLCRVLVYNMIIWVSSGYTKKILILWVWYGVKVESNNLLFSLWYSHPIRFVVPSEIVIVAEKDVKGNDILTFSCINKELLWKIVADIRALKKPEPYKGKWIRYFDEVIKLKAWKTAKK